jgi:integrase
VQAFPLTDVKAHMGHADIATTMIYVHHVPQHDAADRLSVLLANAESPVCLDRTGRWPPTSSRT